MRRLRPCAWRLQPCSNDGQASRKCSPEWRAMAGCASAAEDVQQQEVADVMVEGKTLLVLLLCACCQDPARVPSQPSRVRSVHARKLCLYSPARVPSQPRRVRSVRARKLCLYSPSVLQDRLQSNFMARLCSGRGRKQRNETNIASQRGTLEFDPPPRFFFPQNPNSFFGHVLGWGVWAQVLKLFNIIKLNQVR